MITAQDEQTLQRLLGTENLPSDLVQEVELRTQMFHRAGASGPIGHVALIDACRSLNHKPKQPVAPAGEINWREYPADGSVHILAGPFFGSYKPGVFLGFAEAGMLAIRLDDDDRYVREVRRDMVKLGVQPREEEEEGPDARASLLEDKLAEVENPNGVNASIEITEQAVALAEPPKQAIAKKAMKKKNRGEFDQPLVFSDEVPAFDWSAVEAGKPVWVTLDGDIVDATFNGISPDGKLRVSLPDGKEQECDPSDVTYSG